MIKSLILALSVFGFVAVASAQEEAAPSTGGSEMEQPVPSRAPAKKKSASKKKSGKKKGKKKHAG
jgi:hypothetical protein